MDGLRSLRSSACLGVPVVEIKFCGLTRARDAALAATLGAAYVGVIFAGGPRRLDAVQAREVFAGLEGSHVRRVGVFGAQSIAEIARDADALALDVVQLHSEATPTRVSELHRSWDGEVWAVVGVAGGALPDASPLVGVAEGVVIDSVFGGRSGGTGTSFAWSLVAPSLAPLRGRLRLVVAGGLKPMNVAEAVSVLAPDVVDVSSGVELAPGIKDPQLMRAFAAAIRSREE